MKAFIFSLFSFTLFLSCFCQHIQILLPSTLRTWVSASGITDGLATTIMPFGHIPWGRKIQGRLVLANPTNACDMITIEDKPKKAFILVAQRDDCDLYIKAQNAEKTGARMLIITDNTGNGPSEIKLPPNSIGPINIPTVMVKKAVGDLLLEALNIDDEEFSNIIASVDFPVTRLSNPEYVIGISSGNRESYRFLKEWEQYYKLLLPGTIVTEQGVFYKNPFISMKVTYLHKGYINQESKVNRSRDCACSGYCVPLEYKDSPANGSDLIKEDLRQICLYYDDDGKYRNKWWQYVIAYGDLCFDNANVEECSSKIMRSLDIDATKVAACVDGSWNNCANTILDQKKFSYYRQSAAAEMGISLGDFKIVPSVSIEQMWINNTIPAIGLFEYLCQVAGTMPEKCVGMFDTTMINPNLNKGTPPGELRSNVDVPAPSKLESGSKSDSRSQSETGPKSETQAEISTNQKESSGSQGYVLLIMFALILTGLFFWRRHIKRTNYQTVEESPSGVA